MTRPHTEYWNKFQSQQAQIGKRVRSLRENKGLSQRGLGEAAGVTQMAVHAIESGRWTSFELLERLCRCLNTSADMVAFGRPDPAALDTLKADVAERLQRSKELLNLLMESPQAYTDTIVALAKIRYPQKRGEA